jgi:hypothetical protein
MFPGMELSGSPLQEGVASYRVSVAELIQALGVFGFIGFAFLWGLKAFKLMPTEARALHKLTIVEAPAQGH